MSKDQNKSQNVIAVIGATSSLARAVIHQLAQVKPTIPAECELVLCGRDADELAIMASDITLRYGVKARTYMFDLMEADIMDHVATMLHETSPNALWVFAGHMGSDDYDDPRNIADVTHVNYTVPAQIMSMAAHQMAEKKETVPILVGVSSVAGDRGRASNYIYGSAKAAFTSFLSGLRNRYAKQKLHVMTVKPGFVDTPMTYAMQSPLIANRHDVARMMVQAATKRKDVVYVPGFWRYIMLIICTIPERIFKKLSL